MVCWEFESGAVAEEVKVLLQGQLANLLCRPALGCFFFFKSTCFEVIFVIYAWQGLSSCDWSVVRTREGNDFGSTNPDARIGIGRNMGSKIELIGLDASQRVWTSVLSQKAESQLLSLLVFDTVFTLKATFYFCLHTLVVLC